MTTDVTTGSHTFIVCVKYTLDVEEIKVDPVTGEPNLEHATYRINDFDENGIEAALQLRDEHGGRVLAISVIVERPPENVLLRALAMGVDELHIVCDEALRGCDALATSTILAALVHKLGAFDVLVCSDTSVDEYRGEVGPRLAEALSIPSVTHVTRLALQGERVQADRALESWLETLEVAVPALVTVGSETNDARLPTLRQIRQATGKPVVDWELADLVPREIYVDTSLRISTLATYAPPSVRKRVIVDGESPDETARKLVDRLLEDAVIRI
jgi:electron transfer flavoprotein beta subunit